jgi:hypothetical protein
MNNLDLLALERKSIVAQHTTVGCWIPNNNLNSKAHFNQSTFCIWGLSAHTITFLKMPPQYFISGDLHKLVKSNENCFSHFWENHLFVFWGWKQTYPSGSHDWFL